MMLSGPRRVLLPPANEVLQGNVFTGVCLSTRGRFRSLSRGVSIPEGSLSRGSLSGGLCPGGLYPVGSLSRGLCLAKSLSRGVSVRGSLSRTPPVR